jgi:DNA-binding beta-propeller fold protein YncE
MQINKLKKCVTLIVFLFLCQFVLGQTPKKEYYKNGQNGIELISQSKSGTVVISTYNAKLTIKDEIAQNFYQKYLKNEVKTDSIMIIEGKTAKVTGKCKIIKKAKLTSVNFYYEKVEWASGLIEEHIN